ncbi:MAG: cadherin-like domain-containing protein, partial [Ilumatobacter sp.]|nr:cadherin-like domain-containing protein [Ilumatobacter sp.]
MFDAAGGKVGSEILVNTATTGTQDAPQITALPDGRFVITWGDQSQGVGGASGDSSSYAVKAQVFDGSGGKVGSEILVNTATAGVQYAPQITTLSDGSFVITWQDLSHGVGGATGDTSGLAIKAQVYSFGSAPTGADNTITTDEDTGHTFSASEFGFADADGDTFAAVRIDSLPSDGSLELNGTAVVAGDEIDAADIGQLVFTPGADENGTGYTSFTFSVKDSSGSFDATSRTITFDVTAVDDPPTGADNTITTDEDTAYTFSASDFGFSDVDSDTFAAVRIDSVPGAGSLELNGVAVANGDVVDAADIGLLVFTPGADDNGSGYASFTFSVKDSAGTFDTTPRTITVDVTPVDDPPTGADKTITTNEDTAHIFSASDFGFSDVDGDTLAAVRIDTVPGAGSLTLNGVAVAATDVVAATDIGLLVFTPGADDN